MLSRIEIMELRNELTGEIYSESLYLMRMPRNSHRDVERIYQQRDNIDWIIERREDLERM